MDRDRSGVGDLTLDTGGLRPADRSRPSNLTCTPGIAATEAERNKLAADRAFSAPDSLLGVRADYCGRDCHRVDWRFHKYEGKVLARALKLMDAEAETSPKSQSGAPIFTADASPCSLSQAFTVARAAGLAKTHGLLDDAPVSPFRMTLVGSRSHVEGAMDFALVRRLLIRVLPGLKNVQFDLVGPEVVSARPLSGDGYVVHSVNGTYHEAVEAGNRQLAPDLACVLNGGIDNFFASWAPSLELLRKQGTPVAFTGYVGIDDPGCERLLKLFDVPRKPNPFGWHARPGMARDGLMVLTCGKGSPQEHTPNDMLSVHKAEHLARLLDLASINEEEGNTHVVRKLNFCETC
eukprot:jgi/Tetstr1/456052/TSEL_042822.t1